MAKKRLSWTKYGGARMTQAEYDDDTHWYCQICTKKFDKVNDKYYTLPLGNDSKDLLKLCERCKQAVDNDGYDNWEQIYNDYKIVNKRSSVKYPKYRIKMDSDESIELRFKVIKSDRLLGEHSLMVDFLEQMVDGKLDNLTPQELKEVAESVLVRIQII